MLYLAYGSNLHPLRLVARTPSARLLGTRSLPGWSLELWKPGQDGSAKATLVPDRTGQVHAAIYDVEDSERIILDRCEGLGRGYELETLAVEGYGTCFTYVSPRHVWQRRSLPFTWYRDLIVAGCEFHGFPEAYVEAVRSIPAELDGNLHRHREHMRLVESAPIA